MTKKYLNVVLDLETLGTAHDAAIIQIGAVVPQFDLMTNMQQAQFEATIRFEDALQLVKESKCSMTKETMDWWEKQPTRTQVFSGQESYVDALRRFSDWIYNLESETGLSVVVWGNGADFDPPILRHSLDLFGIHNVWKYYNTRCLRTVKNILMSGTMAWLPDEIPHTALGDAKYEARLLNYVVNQAAQGAIDRLYI